jgi:hypothetical protein
MMWREISARRKQGAGDQGKKFESSAGSSNDDKRGIKLE